MFALAFGIAIGAGALVGTRDEGPLTVLGGALTFAFDLFYRWLKQDENWLITNKGGSMIFLPAWVLAYFGSSSGLSIQWDERRTGPLLATLSQDGVPSRLQPLGIGPGQEAGVVVGRVEGEAR